MFITVTTIVLFFLLFMQQIVLPHYKKRKNGLDIVSSLATVSYYNHLMQTDRVRFATRVQQFIAQISFIGKEGMKITPMVEVSIAASMVQLTFGLPEVVSEKFDRVYVYPRPFYVEAFGQELRGGVSPEGQIFIAWSTFQNDNYNHDDGINLGLHEMAHALKISGSQGYLGEEFRALLNDWENMSAALLANPPENLTKFLRKYGFTNTYEFFSVCVEHFFEQPVEFYEVSPALFKKLAALLNQNPLS